MKLTKGCRQEKESIELSAIRKPQNQVSERLPLLTRGQSLLIKSSQRKRTRIEGHDLIFNEKMPVSNLSGNRKGTEHKTIKNISKL